MLGGNIFSIAFGRNLDSHSDDEASPAGNSTLSVAASALSSLAANATASVLPTSEGTIHARGGLPSAHHCIIGRECYRDSIKLTMVACTVALGLGIYAGWRDTKRQRRYATRADVPSVVIWEDEE